MFLRQSDGPRVVTLLDGRTITPADLPPPDTRRWVASRKAAVVQAVQAGLITLASALETYGLSEEEFPEWEAAVRDHGVGALRVTWLQRYRQTHHGMQGSRR
jgi:hypothetical protein